MVTKNIFMATFQQAFICGESLLVLYEGLSLTSKEQKASQGLAHWVEDAGHIS